MKKYLIISLSVLSMALWAQETPDSLVYKKKVLDNTEISIIGSFYKQDGPHAAVNGGIGTEELQDISPEFVVNIPLNDDDVLSVTTGISAYSSASSSNINPFDISQASGDDDDDDDDDDDHDTDGDGIIASPWVESSGPSGKDVRFYTNVGYSHSSDDRNQIISANASFSAEYDYTSIGGGISYTRLFNEKNTELSIGANAFFDTWKPIYPTELKSFIDVNGDLNQGFFQGIPIELRDQVEPIGGTYNPQKFTEVDSKNRNTYFLSLSFSQILSENIQISLFSDIIYMDGLLSTPYHRVYFADKNNFYIEDYHLADDREILPDTRVKIPIGMRLNYYINDWIIARTYYRYYQDDWGMTAHTASIELPVKITDAFTVYPMYRYYTQTAVDYFLPYNTALSTDTYYTSDYDLSEFDSQQYGGGIRIAPPLGLGKIGNLYMKSFDLRYNHYTRSNDLDANIISFALDLYF